MDLRKLKNSTLRNGILFSENVKYFIHYFFIAEDLIESLNVI